MEGEIDAREVINILERKYRNTAESNSQIKQEA